MTTPSNVPSTAETPRMQPKPVPWLLLVLLLATPFLEGCAVLRFFFGSPEEVKKLNDGEIGAIVERLGGRLLTSETIELGGGFNVSAATGNTGIEVTYVGVNACREYCWVQSVRESLDGEIIQKPSSLDPDDATRQMQDNRVVNGFTIDGKTLCNPVVSMRGYNDRPRFPERDFKNNPVNPNASIYALELEVCPRCLNPESKDYLGCVQWSYIRVLGERGKSYLVSRNEATEPSDDFLAAVDAFK